MCVRCVYIIKINNMNVHVLIFFFFCIYFCLFFLGHTGVDINTYLMGWRGAEGGNGWGIGKIFIFIYFISKFFLFVFILFFDFRGCYAK